MEQPPAKITDDIIEKCNRLDIYSDRLSLKKFTEQEIEYNVAHEMNPVLMRYIRDITTVEETRKKTTAIAQKYSGYESDWLIISIRHNKNNEYLGIICFRYESILNDTVEIGWRLDSQYHGKGYATEAAIRMLDFIKEEFKPHKIVAYCVSENIASMKIMEKLGMSQEACLVQFSKINDQWIDELIYGLVLNE